MVSDPISRILKHLGAAAAALACVGLFAAPDPAVALPFSVSAGAGASDSDSLSFAQFNPSLGTLTGVRFILSGSTAINSNVSVSAIEITGEEDLFAAAEAQTVATFNIFGPDSVTLFSGEGNATSGCDTTGTESGCSSSGSGGTNPVFVSPFVLATPSDLPSYAGLGTFSIDVEVSAIAELLSCEGICTTPDGDASWDGAVSVEFLFTPGAANGAPEPGTLGLFSLALAGLGAAARRRKAPARR